MTGENADAKELRAVPAEFFQNYFGASGCPRLPDPDWRPESRGGQTPLSRLVDADQCARLVGRGAGISYARRAEIADDLDRLQRAIARLPHPEREVVLLRHYGQLSFAEIAAYMNTPKGTALARAHRGLSKLREWMGSS